MYKTLIIDDEQKIVQLIHHLIEWKKLGLEFSGKAHDGESALKLIEEVQPHIVILDIRMPGLNGLELIQKVKEKNNTIHFIIISGYRHFDYARTAIRYGVDDYLLKPVRKEELNQTLSNVISAKLNNFTEEQVSPTNKALVLKKNLLNLSKKELNEIAFQYSHFLIFCISIDTNSKEWIGETNDLIKGKVNSAFHCLEGKSMLEYTLLDSDHRHLVLLNYHLDIKEELRNYLNEIIEKLHPLEDLFYDLEISTTMSQSFQKIENLSDQYKQLCWRSADRLLDTKPSNLIVDGEIEKPNKVMSLNEKNRLIKSIEKLNPQDISNDFSEIFNAFANQQNITGYEILCLVDQILDLSFHHITSHFEVYEGIEEDFNFCKKLINLQSSQNRVSIIVRDHLYSVLQKQNSLQANRDEKPIAEAKAYISENFFLPLTLETVSEQLDLNASYFSTLFKKKTGMGFIEYLTDIRMEEAKDLLANPKRSLSDTASEVGYKDARHFSRQFKKVVGLSPGEYRKIYY